ncbi:putative quinol monooxygenase [Alloscardovia venturai]|uniref:Quinol monooxygenase n=1 Tax=Alloscardovia venturai TaxID=1769421 RepID=A0ABW2Y9Y3_9BIFI
MTLTINIRYTGKDGAAQDFAREMTECGIVQTIRKRQGNLRYEYYQPLDDPDTILLIDQWTSQAELDAHHKSPEMPKIAELRDKYHLHMKVERFIS